MADQPKVSLEIAAMDSFSFVFDLAQRTIKQMVADGVQATDRLQQSFSRLNIKSQLDIGKERSSIIAAFDQIKHSGVATANEIRRAQESMNAQLVNLDKQLRGVAESSKIAGDGSKHAAQGFTSIRNVLGPLVATLGALSLADLARTSVEAAVKMQALDVQFKTISGSGQMAASNLKYVRDESQRLGLVFSETADSFAKFAASSRGTSMAGDAMRKGFSAVSEAVTAMHLPAEAASRTFAQLSQMMGKGKITAEDMNVIVEAGVVSYADLAKAMNMTIPEFRAIMQNGEALSNEVLPKLFDLLHNTFGEAAKEGASSAQAQFNLFKNTMFELGVVIGQTVLPVVNFFMGRISELANGIRSVVGWLGPFGPAMAATATAMTLAATATTAFSAATAIAEMQTTKLTIAMLKNPLVLAAAAFVGAIVVLKEVIDWFFKIEDAQKKVGEEAVKLAEKERQSAVEKIKVLEQYEAAFGISMDRRLQKLEAQYKKELNAAEEKAALEREEAKGNTAKLLQIEDQLQKDRMGALNRYHQEKSKTQEEDRKKDLEAYNQELKNAREFFKMKGDISMQGLVDRKIQLQSEVEVINKHYDDQLNRARGNVVAEIAIEGARNKEIEEAKKRSIDKISHQAAQALIEQVDRRRQMLDSEIILIKKAAADQVITEHQAEQRITALTVAALRDQYAARRAAADKTKEVLGKNSQEYKDSLKDQENSHKAYISANLDAYKKYAAEIKSLDQQIVDFRLSIQQKIADIKQKNMSESEKYADNEKRFNEAIRKSDEARAAGQHELALKYNKEAEDLAGRLVDKKAQSDSKLVELEKDLQKRILEIQTSSNGAQTDQQRQSMEIAKAREETEAKKLQHIKENTAAIEGGVLAEKSYLRVLEQHTAIRESQKKESNDALAQLEKIQNVKLDPKSLDINLNESTLTQIRKTMSDLTRTETKTIIIKTIQQDGTPSYKGYFAGGKVGSGSPLRDSVSAILAKNEWVINNKATGIWGDGIMSAINDPLSAAGRKLQQIIQGPSAAGINATAPNMGTLSLELGGNSFPVSAPVNVLKELTTALRRMKMARPQ